MRILVTGFEPFGNQPTNPSAEVAQLVASQPLEHVDIIAHVLPVTFDGAVQQLHELIVEFAPDMIVGLGLAANRDAITFERVAINLADAPIPDNAGEQPLLAPVIPDAPTAYFTTLPINAMVASAQEVDVPAHVSLTAGSYVCNAVMFAALHETSESDTRAGFIHVPLERNDLTVPDMARAVRASIERAIDLGSDDMAATGVIS